ncbi:hypothetical protein QQF64_031298 [Cirrhinus molitorella]|uniref:SMB domain-containing protein n=1 Tax=Cirrhinus molitorella TaxID=172907 RepID=A0ABR3MWM4_9TELE
MVKEQTISVPPSGLAQIPQDGTSICSSPQSHSPARTCSHPTLCCSGTNYNCFRGCFCDEICTLRNDCCPDFNSTCTFNSTTVTPPFTSTVTPPFDSTATPSITSTAPPLKVMKVNIPLLKEEYPAVVLKISRPVCNMIYIDRLSIVHISASPP